MKTDKIVSFILILILVFNNCAHPPKPKPLPPSIVVTSELMPKKSNPHLSSKKRLDGSPVLSKQNSTATVNFYEDYKTIEHQITLIPQDLEGTSCFTSWQFTMDSKGRTFDGISLSCEIKSNSKKDCTTSDSKNNNQITFKYEGQICNGDTLIVNFKYNERKTTKDILFHQEPIAIPMVENAIFCNYKFILPDGYINLGLENNTLTKQSDKIYTFNDPCPTERQTDVIRFSPSKISWNADTEISLSYPPKFTDDVTFTFPRYYLGGKLKTEIYTLSSLDGESYNEADYIYEDTKYKIKIPAANKDKVGIKLNTNFTNTLTDEFKVYVPESYYEIDTSSIDQEIIDKANEIISEESDEQNYYKLGKFVNSYMTYDLAYSGKVLTVNEIYNKKRGVCEHYTKLYNAMLNSVGIKTLYISGWAFDGNQTSGNKDTIGHAWTAALIDNKWKELDATWGLFEGIPAGHILKTIGEDEYSYSGSEKDSSQISLAKDNNIKATSVTSSGNDSNDNTNKSDDSKDSDKNEKDEENESDSIVIIRINKSIYQMPSLFLLILLFFN